jgi:hypothetical protein
MNFYKTALLAPLLAALFSASAAEIPEGWDLTFSAVKAGIPPSPPNTEHCSNLLKEIDRQSAEIQSFMPGVPLERLEEAVLVQDSWHRYGVFIGAGKAYAITNDNRHFSVMETGVAEARDVIRQYAEHNLPAEPGLLSDRSINECSSLPRAVVSILRDGKSRQFWLSGWDFAETLNKWRGADLLGVLLLSGNGSGNHQEPRWAGLLSDKVHKMAR